MENQKYNHTSKLSEIILNTYMDRMKRFLTDTGFLREYCVSILSDIESFMEDIPAYTTISKDHGRRMEMFRDSLTPEFLKNILEYIKSGSGDEPKLWALLEPIYENELRSYSRGELMPEESVKKWSDDYEYLKNSGKLDLSTVYAADDIKRMLGIESDDSNEMFESLAERYFDPEGAKYETTMCVLPVLVSLYDIVRVFNERFDDTEKDEFWRDAQELLVNSYSITEKKCVEETLIEMNEKFDGIDMNFGELGGGLAAMEKEFEETFTEKLGNFAGKLFEKTM